ncbi:SDR family NAD(P)-dependent oxidoreductase [Dapis sp. BLCC M126]|uniref:SDR family NAD(P)-dependent oxidoreductase n=1 Tax=Dapis sp. BLCC M126 TaxID=3400189 RepID=UPI003CE6EA50
MNSNDNTALPRIAIVGVSCRFPGADTKEEFWQLLKEDRNSIQNIPSERWGNLFDSMSSEIDLSTQRGGFLTKIDLFDSSFFRITPREAQLMDPQQRLLLELSWEAMEDAGYASDTLKGKSVGVYVGVCHYDYRSLLEKGLETTEVAQIATGTAPATFANRISYFYDFHGPSLTVDTACSSSLVAMDEAVNAIRREQCETALVGGVNLICSPVNSRVYTAAGMLSPDGVCRVFDAGANGFVRGEGGAVVVLKDYQKALRDGDSIYGVIRSVAVNHGGQASSFTAPNPQAQAELLEEAYREANIEIESVGYIEAHGTGTSLGDPIEVEALNEAFQRLSSSGKLPANSCGLGSVKTNIGHLEGAAGMAGLIKVLLCMRHTTLPSSLNYQQLNPDIELKEGPFFVVDKLQSWEAKTDGAGKSYPLRAGLSSFGFAGTNAHVVLEQGKNQKQESRGDREPSVHLLTLSAKTETALSELVVRYQKYLNSNPESELADICYSANTGRVHFNHRFAAIASSKQDLAEKLKEYQSGEATAGVLTGELPERTRRLKVAFLFTGQGSQYVNMGKQLYQTQPVFREVLDRCDTILSSEIECSLLDVLYNNQDSSLLNQTAYTQPALFAIEYALYKLWESWGIKPNIVMGHSVGEYVAATVAGVFSLEDGLRLIAARGRLMQQLPSGGEMVSVMASESTVGQLLEPYKEIAIAAINGPESTVISGDSVAVTSVVSILQGKGIKTKKLEVSHAFHSPLMEPMLAEFEAIANQLTYKKPQIPIISNVTGTKADQSIASPQYWVNHVRQPVRFAQGMKTLHQQGYEIFLEVGPKPVLLGMGRQCLPENVGVWLPSLRPNQIPLPSPNKIPLPSPLERGKPEDAALLKDGKPEDTALLKDGKSKDAALLKDEWQQMLLSLGNLYVKGAKIDWLGFNQDYARQKVGLPTYPFQRERHWIETKVSQPQKHQKSENISETPIVKLLTQGKTEALIQQLERSVNFSPEKLKLLPEILEVLAQQHQEQLAAVNVKNWFYEVQWQPLAQTKSKTSIQLNHWLIFADTTGVAEKLAQKLQQQGHKYSLVYRGESYQKQAAGKYKLNPNNPEEFYKLYQEIQQSSETPITKLIHLWSLDAPESKDLTLEVLEASQRWGCGSVMHLLQTLLKNSSIPKLWLVTRGCQSVLSQTENNIAGLAASPLWGLGRVVSLEHPQLWGGLVDLDPQVAAGNEVEMLWQLLVNEQEEDNLALRGENTYVARLARQEPPEFPEPLSLSSDGSYLITGGLGALGLLMAEWLVSKGAKNIVLTGRRPPSEKVSESLKKLEETGCQVTVLLGDVSIEADIAKILEEIQTSLPTLKGIIHTAGVLDDGTIKQMNWERFAKVMSPKVAGTWHLHTLTQNLSLDFFVCFSSLASLIGSPGQGNYAAANAFMDAFASYRRSRGLSGLAINWGAWASGGMAARLAVEHQNRIQSSGINEIAPKQGMYALDLLLGNQSAQGQVGVMAVQWQVLAEQWSSIEKSSLVRELLQKEELKAQETPKQKVKAEILAKLETALLEERQEILTEHIRGQVAQILGLSSSQLPKNLGFMEMGMDSLMTVELKNRLQNQLRTTLSETIAIEYPTIAKLSSYIIEELIGWKTTELEASLSQENQETKLEMMESSRSEAIAIIGIGCRFPGNANTPESFWELLSNGKDSVKEIPLERWDLDYYYDPNPETPGKMYIRHAALVDQVDRFDPIFFSISGREAHSLDPQQRLILEVTWEALERGGINPQQLENTQTGVFLGIGQNDYANLGLNQVEDVSPYDVTGNTFCFAAGRLSYFLGLQGPSMAIDTACSSSLVALHEACQSLRQGESNLALAGGVQLILSPQVTTGLSRTKALSPDGKCKTFDAAADGYGRGEGCGIVVLKRLSDALKDGDNICAVIRGSAVNHDGPSGGLTVPNKLAQEKLIQQALKAAKVEPLQVSYVEAHGTGTSLGDPMEVRALASVFEQGRDRENPLHIASVKTNIGHLEPAAGIAGVIKVVLQLQHQKIAPHLNFANPNPYIDWENMPFKVPTQLTPWLSSEEKRVAGVSSFGMSGTNAHIVLEEAPTEVGTQNPEASPQPPFERGGELERPVHILTLSAKTEKALGDLVNSYQSYLEAENNDNELGDICYTANIGRAKFDHTLAVLASEKQDLIKKLKQYKEGENVTGIFSGQVTSETTKKIAFLFTGQGSQYLQMGRQLYETQPTFQKIIDQCSEILGKYLEVSLLDVLYPGEVKDETSTLIDQTRYTQPAIFAIEYALAKLWESWGIKPNVMMGHSVGEYVAATVAGVFGLEDGLKLIAMRGKLMQKLPSGGEMVSVMASESQVTEAIKEYSSQVTIAAFNGPESIVISGESAAIASICSRFESEEVKTKQLQVSHAFHSPLMEPMLAEFEAVAKEIIYNEPKTPLVSNVTGTEVDGEIATAEYWVGHVRQPVRFAQGMETLRKQGIDIFLEIGPKPILLGMGRECLMGERKLWLPSLRSGKPDWLQMLQSLGGLYAQAIKIDWLGFDRDYSRNKVELPTYPWQRKRYWITDIRQWKSQEKKSIKSEKQVKLNGVNIQQQEIQMNKDKMSQQPKLKLSAPGSLSLSDSASTIDPSPKKELAKLGVKVKPADIESENIQLNNLDTDETKIRETLKESLADVLYVDISEIEEDKKFVDLGLDSIVGVEWITNINKTYNLNIKATKLYDYPTLLDLSKYIAQTLSNQGKNTNVERSLDASSSQVSISNQPQLRNESQSNFSQVKEILKQQLAEALYVDISEIEEDKKFVDLGLDSIVGVEWITNINQTFNLNIKATKLYDYPTLLDLGKYIAQSLSNQGKNIDVERSPDASSSQVSISNQPQLRNDSQKNFSQVREILKQQLAEALYVDISEIEEDKKFVDLGLDSIVGVEWVTNINQTFNLNIKATKLYDYPTLLDLTKYITQEINCTGGSRFQTEDKESTQKDYLPVDSQEEMKQKLRSILSKVANKELTAQEANQMIQKIKNQVK